ncbi:MAG: amino acid adenylation domain-containing protein [Pseudomonadota bacterium]
MSFAQERLWFLQQVDPDNVAYNVGALLALDGPLNEEALTNALDQIVSKQASLRTRFLAIKEAQEEGQEEGTAYQHVDREFDSLLEIIDLRKLPEPERLSEERFNAQLHAPFKLDERLLRLSLLRIDEQRFRLSIVTHHIICDRWSVMIFMRELGRAYAEEIAGESHLDPKTLIDASSISYCDWAAWQRDELAGERLQQGLSYWREKLLPLAPTLELPFANKVPQNVQHRGGQHAFKLPSATTNELRDLAGKQQASLFTTLLAAFNVLLFRYGAGHDICVGSEVANRDRPEITGLIGLFVNTLVLRAKLYGEESFIGLLERVKETVNGALAHQYLPFEKLVQELNPSRDFERLTPLFDVKFDLQQIPVSAPKVGDVKFSALPIPQTDAKYILRFNLQENDTGISGQIEFSEAYFDASSIAQIADHYIELLRDICANPSRPIAQYSLLSNDGLATALTAGNQAYTAQPPATLHAAITRQAALTPDAIAIVDSDESLDYATLLRRSRNLAAELRKLNLAHEQRVGIGMRRGANMIVAMLAVLESGGVYVPLDSDYPAARLAFIIDDAEISIIVGDGSLASIGSRAAMINLAELNLDEPRDEAPEFKDINPEQLAYIIYTSGSTGQPKGVAIEHRNAAAMVGWASNTFTSDELNQVLAATSISFDLSIYEIFVPLSVGASVVVADNALSLRDQPNLNQITLINTVPSAISELLKQNAIPKSVSTINLAGEALHPSLVKDLRALPHVKQVNNLYGPSEDTTYSTHARLIDLTISKSTARVPIGLPIEGTRAYVLDEQMVPVPTGIAGELYLSGAGVARGYLGRPALTAEKFVPNPFADGTSVLYRTGDRVIRLADGQLEFLGRQDQQLKIRGFRIEAGEVEATLTHYRGIEEVAVVAHTPVDKPPELVAYIGSHDDSLTASTLRSWLAERVPSAFIPTRWQFLRTLPKLPNGKLDRAALPEPNQSVSESAYAPPTNPTEEKLAALWATCLSVEKVGINDNFFDLGGHSLLAIRLVGEMEQLFDRYLPLKVLFESPTIASLAAAVLAGQFDNTEIGRTQREAIVPDPIQRHAPFPLTDIQHAYWLGRTSVFELGNIGTHGYREIETQGLDPQAVEAALNQLITRHDMLRAVVEDDGLQRILPTVPAYTIRVTDCRDYDAEALNAHILETRERLSHQLFDPKSWPLFEVVALRCRNNVTRYCVSFDVLIGDAFSLQVLGQDMRALMSSADLSTLNLSFRDYVISEQQHQASSAYEHHLEYWLARAPHLPPAPQLPLKASGQTPPQPEFKRRRLVLPAAQWQSFKHFARQSNVSPSTAILAVFATVLARYCRHNHFTLNLTLFNRPPIHPEVNRLVGDFTSSLLLAVKLDYHHAFDEQAREIQQQLWEDLEHRAVSGVRVLRELARISGRHTGALMPVVFTSTLDHTAIKNTREQDDARVVYGLSQTSQVYLDHQVSEINEELHANWDSIDALFPREVLDSMFANYQTLIEQLANEQTSWQTHIPSAPATHWSRYNATQQSFGDRGTACLQSLFFSQAKSSPDTVAIIDGNLSVTYDALARYVLSVSDQLVGQVATNELVAVSLAKGWRQVVATLAVLTAGAAYVPIDPALPAARRRELFSDANARVLIFDRNNDRDDWAPNAQSISVDEQLDISSRWQVPEEKQHAADLAYVIYTSGSTGKPKGVMIDHQGAVNTILDINERMAITASDRVFALSSLSFDLSVYDIFGALAAGAAIVMPQADLARDPAHWRERLTTTGVTIWNSVPALLQLLVTELEAEFDANKPSALRVAMMSGDWIPVTLPTALKKHFPDIDLYSLGGATEASIWSIIYPITRVDENWSSIPYGKPMANQTWYVLDDNGEPCPPWVTGELYIGGRGLALGYWQRPDLTAASFVPDRFDDSPDTLMLYRTGDIGRYGADGNIEFLGREDHQVKIGGNRVELGEIESQLLTLPAIEEAVVTVNTASNELVGYVVPANTNNDRANPLARLAVKNASSTLTAETDGMPIDLPSPEDNDAHIRRQSHRQFLTQPMALSDLAAMLACLRAHQVSQGIGKKYRYPSAGSLYPVRVVVEVKADAFNDLNAGWYSYDQSAHQLHALRSKKSLDEDKLYSANSEAAENRAFAIYFIADLNAIENSYGERARDFCLLEAGYMGQLLMESAPSLAIGLCPLNDPGQSEVADCLNLPTHQIPIHGLFGGAIDLEWNSQWMAAQQAPKASFQSQLTDHLREHLPAYMVPSRFVVLESLPLTANGKIDRSALPEPSALDNDYLAPRTTTEQAVTDIWQTLLEIDKVGVNDDFFQRGGNSMLAVQLLVELRQLAGCEIAMADLFAALTPAKQSVLVDEAQKSVGENEIQRVARNETNIDELSDDAIDAMLNKVLSERD